ncbi:patatin-like phospholipase family protein [Tolypothrix sp. FACHB-123]|uniref:patatin-like phospholipase family protein n=1 Tax=Tolypothrix sp. FACHB-123 TaxID=2692868 RepID=UPI001683D0EA|nr:patatin-like phospholipase family protein [Tolypothrix sp. FACHB-123]MBD2356696.1 patatin-like phospholipase family protein [Tolypothrix sp. FACHB-123]
MNSNNQQSNLPQNIGLALSGGGYRAAVFHLGLLFYLNRVNLLQQVKMISTVSGGTFTGAKYTLSLVEKKSFAEFYQEYSYLLKNTRLVELALKNLSKKSSKKSSARHDLITASAQVYAEKFFQNPQGKPYRFGDILQANIHLQEVIFNATEFRSGLAFRFQRSANLNAKIGNGKISIERSDAEDIRVADIVAASSCFPGGFEPLAFPGDFNWSKQNIFNNVRAVVHEKLAEDLALMDGGIYDNQGIDSLWLAEKRSDFPLDLFIISDVDERPGTFYSFPPDFKVSNLKLQTIDWLSKILIVFCLFTVITVAYEAIKDYISGQFIWLDFFLYIIPFFLALATAFILFWGRNIIKNQILPAVPQAGIVAWNDLKSLTINQVINAISLRLTSLQAMAGSVFMNRIRNMGFSFIYQQYRDKDKQKKLISNLIYELRAGGKRAKLPIEVKPISPEILKVIDAAATMPTTLWFTEDNQFNNVMIAGQVTSCYNLMVYITRNHGDEPSSYPQDIQKLWAILVQDWNGFCVNPQNYFQFLLKETLKNK